jgi:hypothetical protein
MKTIINKFRNRSANLYPSIKPLGIKRTVCVRPKFNSIDEAVAYNEWAIREVSSTKIALETLNR